MQNRTHRSLVASVLTVVVVAGYQTLGAQPSPQGRGALPAGTPLPRPRVPIGYDPAAENLGFQIRAPKIDGPGFSAPVTNRGTKTIVGLTYVAIVARVPHAVPVTVLTSPEWAITLAPGQTTEVGSPGTELEFAL